MTQFTILYYIILGLLSLSILLYMIYIIVRTIFKSASLFKVTNLNSPGLNLKLGNSPCIQTLFFYFAIPDGSEPSSGNMHYTYFKLKYWELN